MISWQRLVATIIGVAAFAAIEVGAQAEGLKLVTTPTVAAISEMVPGNAAASSTTGTNDDEDAASKGLLATALDPAETATTVSEVIDSTRDIEPVLSATEGTTDPLPELTQSSPTPHVDPSAVVVGAGDTIVDLAGDVLPTTPQIVATEPDSVTEAINTVIDPVGNQASIPVVKDFPVVPTLASDAVPEPDSETSAVDDVQDAIEQTVDTVAVGVSGGDNPYSQPTPPLPRSPEAPHEAGRQAPRGTSEVPVPSSPEHVPSPVPLAPVGGSPQPHPEVPTVPSLTTPEVPGASAGGAGQPFGLTALLTPPISSSTGGPTTSTLASGDPGSHAQAILPAHLALIDWSLWTTQWGGVHTPLGRSCPPPTPPG